MPLSRVSVLRLASAVWEAGPTLETVGNGAGVDIVVGRDGDDADEGQKGGPEGNHCERRYGNPLEAGYSVVAKVKRLRSEGR